MAIRFSDLPTEIWLLIADYIPKSQLFQLKSLNIFFLNCWLTIRWKEITIGTEFPDRTVDLLMRVFKDPFVVTRTKSLNICLTNANSSSSESFDTALALLLRSLPLMPAITTLKIEIYKSAIPHFATLFRTIACSPSFSRTLQSLFIYTNVEMFISLAERTAHCSPFQNLSMLTLGTILGRVDIPANSSREIAPFLLFLAPTLQFLGIATWVDLTPLFDTLTQSDSSPTFPNLKSLVLIFTRPFLQSSPQSSPQSLRRFLLTHNDTLQYLHLDTSLDASQDAWLAELVNVNFPFPSLQALDIYPPTSQPAFSALLTLLKRTAPTLSSLSISYRYLTADEARQVIDALTERGYETQVQGTTIKQEQRKLKSLCMDITRLSVPFLDLLSRKFPHLEKLSLRVSRINDSDQDSFYDTIHLRHFNNNNTTPTQDSLHTWKLLDLSISRAGRADMEAVRAVAGAVPALARTRQLLT